MFRARFHDVFPRGLQHYGPQDIEKGLEESPPGEGIQGILCALLGLLLNRKKDVEYGRHPMPGPARRSGHARFWISPANWPQERMLIRYLMITD